jgi:hypothetical protein
MALTATDVDCPSILSASTNVIEIINLRDVLLGEPGTVITAATVSAQIFEEDGVTLIAGIPDPITLSADGGGNPEGNYRGLVPAGAAVSVGDRFRAVITALDAGNTLTVTIDGIVVE